LGKNTGSPYLNQRKFILFGKIGVRVRTLIAKFLKEMTVY